MKPLAHLIAAAAVAVPMPFHAVAADRRFPDWPCVQVRVPEISIAAVWTGQPLDDVRNTWRNEPRISDLVARLAARRTPLEEAKQGTVDFIRGGDGDRQERAKVLFAGLFETLSRERLDVINGLERLTRKQREFASRIESDAARLRELQVRPDSDQKEIAELTNQVNWETRIFEERRKSVRFACEVPVIIEQRLFALGRVAQQALD